MKILHCCLSCFYIDGYNYQENVLPSINKKDGHEVEIIASTETFIDNCKLGYVEPGKYFTKDGIEINRVAYKRYLPHFIMKKIRHYCNIYNLIEGFAPDVILFHGACAYELLTVAKYKKNNPNVKLYVDSHEDKNNSGTNWLSKNLLHKSFYKKIIRKAYKYIDKILYLSLEVKIFLQDFYDINEDKLEYFPLGGIILDEDNREKYRNKIRQQLKIKNDDILLVHSGKLDKLKRTEELLVALSKVNKDNLRLVIIGSIPEEQKIMLEEIINKDYRVSFLGWKSADDLMEYLCACDLYIQPGSQSATMQNAICCGSAAALYPHESHRYLLKDSVFYVETIEDMKKLFNDIAENRELLEDKRVKTNKIAKELLDYKVLASRLYE